jgi:hypothetical protein
MSMQQVRQELAEYVICRLASKGKTYRLADMSSCAPTGRSPSNCDSASAKHSSDVGVGKAHAAIVPAGLERTESGVPDTPDAGFARREVAVVFVKGGRKSVADGVLSQRNSHGVGKPLPVTCRSSTPLMRAVQTLSHRGGGRIPEYCVRAEDIPKILVKARFPGKRGELFRLKRVQELHEKILG